MLINKLDNVEVNLADGHKYALRDIAKGENVIKNNAATDVSGGILCTDGIHKVRPVWNNGAVTWTEVQ